VSVIAVETPVRRRQGEHFDAGELAKIIAIAKREGIRLHLDGARIFLQAAYTGENVVDYAKPFDTVYVSLYKYFNAASGAILWVDLESPSIPESLILSDSFRFHPLSVEDAMSRNTCSSRQPACCKASRCKLTSWSGVLTRA
jgi:hypothetical protein